MSSAALKTAIQQLAPTERKSLLRFILSLLRDVGREYADDVALAAADFLDELGQDKPRLARIALSIASKALRFAADHLAGGGSGNEAA